MRRVKARDTGVQLPSPPPFWILVRNVGRASANHATGREFKPRPVRQLACASILLQSLVGRLHDIFLVLAGVLLRFLDRLAVNCLGFLFGRSAWLFFFLTLSCGGTAGRRDGARIFVVADGKSKNARRCMN